MFCSTECWGCEDRTCEHYVDKTKLYFENENNKKEIKRLNNIINELENILIMQIEENKNTHNNKILFMTQEDKHILNIIKELKGVNNEK